MLTIELNHDPLIMLVYDRTWICMDCSRHTAVIAGAEHFCVNCMIVRGGKDYALVAGWRLSRSSADHINACRAGESSV